MINREKERHGERDNTYPQVMSDGWNRAARPWFVQDQLLS